MLTGPEAVARTEAILKKFFREPNDDKANAYAVEIVNLTAGASGDPTDSNRGKTTPQGHGAQSRMAGQFVPPTNEPGTPR